MRLPERFAGSVFSTQADAAIGECFAWLHDFRDIQLPPIEPFVRPAYIPVGDYREQKRERRNTFAFTAADIELLRIMAANCTHIEIGGRAIRRPSQHQTGGEVIGRTQWLGKPEWAMDYSKEEIETAVEKAINGDWLGKRQQALIEVMLADIAETRANCAPVIQAPECPF